MENLDEHDIRLILETVHTIATVGFSSDPRKPASYVPEYLSAQGYRVIPVNPTITEINGEPTYSDLLAVPVQVELVQIFRPAQDVPLIVDQAIQIGAKVIWMQEGIVHEPAAQRAHAAGLKVVMDKCMMKMHRQLIEPRF